MRLHEEYLKRKQLRVPLVCFEGNSGVLLRTQEPPYSWMSLSFRWAHDEYWHPGQFYFNKHEFRHNSWPKKKVRIADAAHKLYWDEYEEYVINLVSTLKDDYIVVSGDDTEIAVCEILLSVCDGAIAKLMANGSLGSNFCKKVMDVLKLDNEPGVRSDAAESVISDLRRVSCDMTDNVVYDIRNHLNDSNWLASLFRDEEVFCNSSQEPDF